MIIGVKAKTEAPITTTTTTKKTQRNQQREMNKQTKNCKLRNNRISVLD
jgi:hypothetical protein